MEARSIKIIVMKAEILYDGHSTASNRYYDSKSSINRRHVEVARPIVEVHSKSDYCRTKAEVSKTIVHIGYEIVNR